jgi:hypothetical protein
MRRTDDAGFVSRTSGVTNFFVSLVPTVEESLQLRVLERILLEHLAVSVSQEVFGKASNVLVGDLR